MMIYDVESIPKKHNTKVFILIILIAVTAIALSVFAAMKLANHLHTSIVKENENTQNQIEEQTEGTTRNTENQTIQEEQNTKGGGEESTQNQAPFTETQLEAINKIYSSKGEKRAFLTFDDGPSTTVTPKILAILKQQNIKATFFVLGTMVKSNPNILKQEYEQGHYIANHSYSHVYKTVYANNNRAFEEYQKTESLIQNALGNSNYHSNVFRFPGGSIGGYYNSIKVEAKKIFKEKGVAYLDWNALTNDADGARTKEDIMKNLKSTTKGKNSIVVLMHDAPNKSLTAETLPDVISYLREQGYTFKNLYDII